MGWYFCMGSCCMCRKTFSFNPDLVPSLRIDGIRREVCRECVNAVNVERKKCGLAPHPVSPGAYDPAEEGV